MKMMKRLKKRTWTVVAVDWTEKDWIVPNPSGHS